MKHKFTPKMQAALQHYAADPARNKVAAYCSAYSCEKMKKNVIAVKATELFKHPLMAQAIQHMDATVAEKTAIDATWVLERAARLADFNIRKFVTIKDGKMFYDFSTATEEDWYCINEVTMTEDGVLLDVTTGGFVPVHKIKLKAESKLNALKMVGEHASVQAFQKNIKVDGLIGVAQLDIEDYKAAREEMLKGDDC